MELSNFFPNKTKKMESKDEPNNLPGWYSFANCLYASLISFVVASRERPKME